MICVQAQATTIAPVQPKAKAEIPIAQADSPSPPYLARGDEVEKRYQGYVDRLKKTHERLCSQLKKEAPDLYRKLKGEPPKPTAFGYQLLPELLKDDLPGKSKEPPRAVSTLYSWARTNQFLDWEIPKIDEIDEKLKVMEKLDPKDRHGIYAKIVKDYPELEANQRIIDSHIQYNRFWQSAIAGDRPRFDRLTILHDMVLERQAISEALAAKNDADFFKMASALKWVNLSRPREELAAELSEREKKYSTAIHSQNDQAQKAPFIKVKRLRARVWIVEVLVNTDIQDAGYLRRLRSAIERHWFVEDKGDTFKLKIDLRRLSPSSLYKKSRRPKRGDHIDVARHVQLFPKNAAIITTGPNTTYAIPSQYIALGPQPLSENVAAHEFGHILGFIDGYFRGYRDRGPEGFEVMEVVPDPDDIMCTPGAGHVRRYHFERIIEAASAATH